MLNSVTDWCTNWKLSINNQKTKVLHFRPQCTSKSEYVLRCSGNDRELCDSYKYLGVWFDKHLTFIKHAREISKPESRALGSLMSKFITAGGTTNKEYEILLLYIRTDYDVWKRNLGYQASKLCISSSKQSLQVGKLISNISTRGDMGWISSVTKQCIYFFMLLCKQVRSDKGSVRKFGGYGLHIGGKVWLFKHKIF